MVRENTRNHKRERRDEGRNRPEKWDKHRHRYMEKKSASRNGKLLRGEKNLGEKLLCTWGRPKHERDGEVFSPPPLTLAKTLAESQLVETLRPHPQLSDGRHLDSVACQCLVLVSVCAFRCFCWCFSVLSRLRVFFLGGLGDDQSKHFITKITPKCSR